MGIIKLIKDFFDYGPSYQVYLNLGFKARTYNGDFVLTKDYPGCSVHIHQSIEPHNRIFGDLIDFEVDDACVVFEFKIKTKESHVLIDRIRESFDFSYERGNYLFSMNKNMDFNDSKLERTIQELHSVLLQT